MANDIALMKASLKAITDTLSTKPPGAKKDHVEMGLADNFNVIIKDVGAKYPDAAHRLPAPITTMYPYSDMGKASVTYLGLEIMTAQVMNILSVLESPNR